MSEPLDFSAHPALAEDLKTVHPDVARACLAWMQRIRRQPRVGPRREWRPNRDLRDCRAVYVEPTDKPLQLYPESSEQRPGGARWRIVYRLEPTDEDPTLVRAIAAGPKFVDEESKTTIYDVAARRLGRQEVP